MPEPYTREELLSICEAAFVKQSDWHNRDSAHSQRQLGEAYALLKAGCDYGVLRQGNLATNSDTIWLAIEFHGFEYFEYGTVSGETFYLPTPERLAHRAGEDWY